MPRHEIPICPICHKPMRFLLVKATAGREYQCIDCDGEDPMRSPDVSKLLQGVRPPENNTPLSGFAMKHRGIEYTLVRGGGAGVWKWSASVAGVAIMGIATNKSEAVAGAKKVIDRILALKGET